ASPGRRAALRRALPIRRTGGGEPVAELRQVAGARRVPTQRPGIPGRVLARIAAPVADVHGAGIELIRAGLPAATFASAGQSAPVPPQLSGASHSSTAARHSVPGAAKPSAGQSALVPSQLSATSQAPAAARHTVPAACLASAGQLALVPVQVSASSQAPVAARHTVPAWPAGCWHALLLPSH